MPYLPVDMVFRFFPRWTRDKATMASTKIMAELGEYWSDEVSRCWMMLVFCAWGACFGMMLYPFFRARCVSSTGTTWFPSWQVSQLQGTGCSSCDVSICLFQDLAFWWVTSTHHMWATTTITLLRPPSTSGPASQCCESGRWIEMWLWTWLVAPCGSWYIFTLLTLVLSPLGNVWCGLGQFYRPSGLRKPWKCLKSTADPGAETKSSLAKTGQLEENLRVKVHHFYPQTE